MSTNSLIAIKNENGNVTSIYCHWDGYLEFNGLILLQEYTTTDKVNNLIKNGDLSSLGTLVDPIDDMDETKDSVCCYYFRDRKESWGDVRPQTYNNIEEWIEFAGREYNYLFDNGKWYLVTETEITALEDLL